MQLLLLDNFCINSMPVDKVKARYQFLQHTNVDSLS